MYNRYHDYVAIKMRRINENNTFAVPNKYKDAKFVAFANEFKLEKKTPAYKAALRRYEAVPKTWEDDGRKVEDNEYIATGNASLEEIKEGLEVLFDDKIRKAKNGREIAALEKEKEDATTKIDHFIAAYEAAWDKLDDDPFNTARL